MDFSPFQTHLEYLGYKVRTTQEDNVSMLFAEAMGKPDFNITHVAGSDFFIVRSNWAINNFQDDIDGAINELNAKIVNVSSVWHYETSNKAKALGISSAYFGEYDKARFASFMDVYLADVNRVITNKNASKYLNEVKST